MSGYFEDWSRFVAAAIASIQRDRIDPIIAPPPYADSPAMIFPEPLGAQQILRLVFEEPS